MVVPVIIIVESKVLWIIHYPILESNAHLTGRKKVHYVLLFYQ